MQSTLFSLAFAGVLTFVAAVSASSACRADESSRTTAPAVPPAPAASSPQTPAASAQSPSGQTPATGQSTSSQSPPAASQTAPETKQGAASTGETVDLSARPFAYVEGKAGRDEIYGAILGSLGLVKQDMDKTGVKPAGRPLAVFVESDDFRLSISRRLSARRAPCRQDQPFRCSKDRSNAERQSDALRTPRFLCRY